MTAALAMELSRNPSLDGQPPAAAAAASAPPAADAGAAAPGAAGGGREGEDPSGGGGPLAATKLPLISEDAALAPQRAARAQGPRAEGGEAAGALEGSGGALRGDVAEVEAGNLAQQALLRRDGWYGNWDMTTGERVPWDQGMALRAARVVGARGGAGAAGAVGKVREEELGLWLAGLRSGAAATRVQAARGIAAACRGHRYEAKGAMARDAARMAALLRGVAASAREEQAACCEALASACDGSPACAELAQRGGAVPGLLMALRASGGVGPAAAAAALALAHVCEGSAAARRDALRAGGVQQLLDVARVGSGEVQRCACLALAAVSEIGEEVCALLLRHGAAALCVQLLRSAAPGLAAASCRLARAWVAHAALRCAMQELGLVGALVHAMGLRDLGAEAEAAAALEATFGADEALAGAAEHAGVVPALLVLCQKRIVVTTVLGQLPLDAAGRARTEELLEAAEQERAHLARIAREQKGEAGDALVQPEQLMVLQLQLEEFHLRSCLRHMDPHADSFVEPGRWFDGVASMLRALLLLLAAPRAATTAAEAVLRYPQGLATLLRFATQPPAGLQADALALLAALCANPAAGAGVAEALHGLYAAARVVPLLRADRPATRDAAVRLLCLACRASPALRTAADRAGLARALGAYLAALPAAGEGPGLQDGAREQREVGELLMALLLAEESALLVRLQDAHDDLAQERVPPPPAGPSTLSPAARARSFAAAPRRARGWSGS